MCVCVKVRGERQSEGNVDGNVGSDDLVVSVIAPAPKRVDGIIMHGNQPLTRWAALHILEGEEVAVKVVVFIVCGGGNGGGRRLVGDYYNDGDDSDSNYGGDGDNGDTDGDGRMMRMTRVHR